MSRTLQVTCTFCGAEFLAERSTAKFCTPKHRTAYSRLPDRIERCMNAALDYIWDIDDLAKKHPATMHMVIAAMMTAENYIEHKRLKLQEETRK